MKALKPIAALIMSLIALTSNASTPNEMKLSIAMSKFTVITSDKLMSNNENFSDILDLYVLEGGRRFFIGTGNYKLCDLKGTPKVNLNGTDITITDGDNMLNITSGKLALSLIVDKNIFQWTEPKNPVEFRAQVRKIANLIGSLGASQTPGQSCSLSASELRDLKDFTTMPLGRVPVSSVISASDARITELCNQYFPVARTQEYQGNYYIRYPEGLDMTIIGKKIGSFEIICSTKYINWGGNVYFDNETSAIEYFNLVISGLEQCGFHMVPHPDYTRTVGYLGYYICNSPGGQLYKMQTYCHRGYDGWSVLIGGSCLRAH